MRRVSVLLQWYVPCTWLTCRVDLAVVKRKGNGTATSDQRRSGVTGRDGVGGWGNAGSAVAYLFQGCGVVGCYCRVGVGLGRELEPRW